jgi:hypothetical protein
LHLRLHMTASIVLNSHRPRDCRQALNGSIVPFNIAAILSTEAVELCWSGRRFAATVVPCEYKILTGSEREREWIDNFLIKEVNLTLL